MAQELVQLRAQEVRNVWSQWRVGKEMSEILIPSKGSGGSGCGLSFWQMQDKCVRKEDGDRDESKFGEFIIAWRTGTFVHQLLEHFYPHGLELARLKFDGYHLDADWCEAMRLFKEYRKHFKPDEFGSSVQSEQSFIIWDGTPYAEKILA